MFTVLIQFRPGRGTNCAPFDHYMTFDEGETYSSMYGSAVDYLYTQLTSGRLRDSLPGSGGCDVTEYMIELGPML